MTPVTSKTVVGVFSDSDQARRVVDELRHAGFSQDSISLVIRSGGPGDGGETSEVVKDAELGAAAGGIGGALLAAVAIPTLGPVLAMGPILAALGGASIGALTGGLIGALTKVGVPESKAPEYAESVERGSAIVTVRTDAVDAERAFRIMDEYGGLDIDTRSDE